MDGHGRRFLASGWTLLIELVALQLAPVFAIWALFIPYLVSSDCGELAPGCPPATNATITLLFTLSAGCLILATVILVARSRVGGRSRATAAAGAVGSLVGWVCLLLVPAQDGFGPLLVGIVLGGVAGGAVLRGMRDAPSTGDDVGAGGDTRSGPGRPAGAGTSPPWR